MNKLVSPQSRGVFGALLSVVGLIVLGGWLALQAHHDKVGMALAFGAIAIIIGMSYYMTNVVPTVGDLIDEAKRRLHQDRMTAMAWQNIEIRQASFSQLSFWSKALMLFSVISGIASIVVGFADLANIQIFARPMMIPGPNHTLVAVSHWASGAFEVMIGVFFIFFPTILRIQMVDRIDEEAARLFREMDGSGNTPH